MTYHQAIMNDEIPLSIGGGIGQSRTDMYLLNKAEGTERDLREEEYPRPGVIRMDCKQFLGKRLWKILIALAVTIGWILLARAAAFHTRNVIGMCAPMECGDCTDFRKHAIVPIISCECCIPFGDVMLRNIGDLVIPFAVVYALLSGIEFIWKKISHKD